MRVAKLTKEECYSKNFGIKTTFKTKALEYKAGLNRRINCMHCYVFLSDESLLM